MEKTPPKKRSNLCKIRWRRWRNIRKRQQECFFGYACERAIVKFVIGTDCFKLKNQRLLNKWLIAEWNTKRKQTRLNTLCMRERAWRGSRKNRFSWKLVCRLHLPKFSDSQSIFQIWPRLGVKMGPWTLNWWSWCNFWMGGRILKIRLSKQVRKKRLEYCSQEKLDWSSFRSVIWQKSPNFAQKFTLLTITKNRHQQSF